MVSSGPVYLPDGDECEEKQAADAAADGPNATTTLTTITIFIFLATNFIVSVFTSVRCISGQPIG